MDTTKTITHVSLCAGYGGIDLGLGRAIPNLRTIAFSEIEAFACANLVAKMEAGLLDAAPIWTNLKTFPWSEFRDRVDILSGGYPCQPFSAAGKRLGTEDPRHLWPFIAAGIVSMRPRVCFFENVEGHISLGLREVISELEGLGYTATWGIFSAREVGAPHQRKRVFILGINNSERLERINAELNHSQGWQIQNRPAGIPDGAAQPFLSDTVRDGSGEGWISCKGSDGSESFSNGESWGTSMANTSHSPDPTFRYAEADRLPSEHRSEICSGQSGGADATAWPSRPGQPQHGWEPPRVVGNGNSLDWRTSSEGWQHDSKVGSTSQSVGNTKHDGSHQRDTEARGENSSSEQGWMQESEGGSSSVGNSEGWSNGQQPTEQQGRDTSGRSSEESGAMGDTASEGLERRKQPATAWTSTNPTPTANWTRQAQPSLGGDVDGATDWLGHAELCVTSDNRTDELRLLGNGVVPATAERAFLVLMDQLLNENP